ncbi:MAG: hypothetical protein AAB899_05135 [Patescibacteria group bacterium]
MGKKQTKDFNNNDFLDYSKEHIFYEVQMLLKVKDLILLDKPSGLAKLIAIESFAIHLRNLITFLYPTKNPRNTDVYAKDFFSDPRKWREVISEGLEKARERANKEVGHLTTGRIAGTPSEKEWKVRELTEEIVPVLKSFCVRADKSKLNIAISVPLSQNDSTS